ncbi:MAG: AI-2E family transporter [Planctomycetes bacterium]|nr:AI-2E family transporter [Planctomycetota bacterium]
MISFPTHAATRLGINIAILLAGVVALWLGKAVFMPMIIALLLAAVLGPAASWLHRTLKFSWIGSCLTVIFGLLLLNLLITFVIVLAATRLVQQVPQGNDEILKFYTDFRTKLVNLWPWQLDEELFPSNPQTVSDIRAYQFLYESYPNLFRNTAEYLSSWLWQWVLIVFLLFFLLLEGRMLLRRVVEIFGPSEEVRNRAGDVLNEMARSVRTYLVWRTIINFGLAIVVGLIYQVAGLRQPWSWAILLAILNYIPYLGPLIAGIPPFLDAFLFTTPENTLLVTVVYWVVIVLEGYLVVPVLMGRSLELNATTVMLACLFWDLVWGITGLFLAMPIMAGVKAVCQSVESWRPWANLMGTQKADAPFKPEHIPPAPEASAEPASAAIQEPSTLTQVGR